MVDTSRGQAHTLEAIVAGVLLLTSVLFALQITAVTPLSASTSNQHIENQQQAGAEGVLSIAAENGELKDAVLYWNRTSQRFHNGTVNGYYTKSMPTPFGRMLERSFADRGIAYNVYVSTYGTNQRDAMIYQGEPSDNAISASRSLVLTNSTRLLTSEMEPGVKINETNFYASNIGASGYYNTIEVQVVVWRI